MPFDGASLKVQVEDCGKIAERQHGSGFDMLTLQIVCLHAVLLVAGPVSGHRGAARGRPGRTAGSIGHRGLACH